MISSRLDALLKRLAPQVERLSLHCCVHLSIVGANLLLFHDQVLEKIAERLASEISTARVKVGINIF